MDEQNLQNKTEEIEDATPISFDEPEITDATPIFIEEPQEESEAKDDPSKAPKAEKPKKSKGRIAYLIFVLVLLFAIIG